MVDVQTALNKLPPRAISHVAQALSGSGRAAVVRALASSNPNDALFDLAKADLNDELKNPGGSRIFPVLTKEVSGFIREAGEVMADYSSASTVEGETILSEAINQESDSTDVRDILMSEIMDEYQTGDVGYYLSDLGNPLSKKMKRIVKKVVYPVLGAAAIVLTAGLAAPAIIPAIGSGISAVAGGIGSVASAVGAVGVGTVASVFGSSKGGGEAEEQMAVSDQRAAQGDAAAAEVKPDPAELARVALQIATLRRQDPARANAYYAQVIAALSQGGVTDAQTMLDTAINEADSQMQTQVQNPTVETPTTWQQPQQPSPAVQYPTVGPTITTPGGQQMPPPIVDIPQYGPGVQPAVTPPKSVMAGFPWWILPVTAGAIFFLPQIPKLIGGSK